MPHTQHTKMLGSAITVLPGLVCRKQYVVRSITQAILVIVFLIATSVAAASLESRRTASAMGEPEADGGFHAVDTKQPDTAGTPLAQGIGSSLNEKAGRDLSTTLITSEARSPELRAMPLVEQDAIKMANRCSMFDLSTVENGASCGAPFSAPCFDWGRCANGTSVYVYDAECSLADSSTFTQYHGQRTIWREVAREAGVLAERYESACLLIMVDSNREKAPCAPNAPLWNNGANHIMVDFGDHSRDQRPIYSNSYAMEAASSQHTCYYRNGYDISIPLWPRIVFHDLQSALPQDRRYFLTFKGTLYLNHHGYEERASVAHLHDDANGVIIAEKCWERLGKTQPPRYVDFCEQALNRFEKYDYQALMNSTFGLVAAGASPGTYRLGEVMSAGAIPVFVVRDWVRPFDEQIDWPAFSFFFSPDQVPRIIETLRAVPPDQLREMQRKSLDAYWTIFEGKTNVRGIARRTMKVLLNRLGFHRA